MRFWDTSAIVPLLIEEPRSAACRALLKSDPVQIVWCLSRVEAVSALWRRHREKALDREKVAAAEKRLDGFSDRWSEVTDVSTARSVAMGLLRRHPLRAADSLQLAAALLVFDGVHGTRPFVALDGTLCTAAAAEGLTVIRPG